MASILTLCCLIWTEVAGATDGTCILPKRSGRCPFGWRDLQASHHQGQASADFTRLSLQQWWTRHGPLCLLSIQSFQLGLTSKLAQPVLSFSGYWKTMGSMKYLFGRSWLSNRQRRKAKRLLVCYCCCCCMFLVFSNAVHYYDRDLLQCISQKKNCIGNTLTSPRCERKGLQSLWGISNPIPIPVDNPMAIPIPQLPSFLSTSRLYQRFQASPAMPRARREYAVPSRRFTILSSFGFVWC